MADNTTQPGFMEAIAAMLKPKDTGPIPQKWLDEMEKNSKLLPAQLSILIQSTKANSKAQLDQTVLQNKILADLSSSMGPSLEKTLISAWKKYDNTDYKNSQVYNEETKKYEARYVRNKDDQKQLFDGLSNSLNNVTSNAVGAGGELEGAAAGEAALKEQQIQPVSIATIQPEALESLKKIFTTSIRNTETAKETAPTGSGIMGALGRGLGRIGDGLKKLGSTDAMKGAVTLGILGATLFIAAKGFQEFAMVDWISLAKGFATLLGLVGVSKLLATSSVEMIIGAAAIGVLGGALWLAGKGFNTFAGLDWESIGKGLTALLSLGAVATVLGLASEFIFIGAGAIAALGLALVPLSYGLNTVSKPFATFTAQVKDLASVSALNILEVSAAIGALSLALAGFGVGSAVSGIGNFIGGVFTKITGSKSPLEQLVDIGKQSESIDRVTNSISLLKQSLTTFNQNLNLDPLKQFVETINSVSLIRLAAITAALPIMLPAMPLIRGASTVNQASLQSTEIPAIKTEAGPAMPVSLVSTRLNVAEAAKLNNIVNTSETKEINELTVVKVQNENLDKLMKKIDVLIASIEPLASSQQSINSSKKTTTTIVNNATNTNNVMGGQDNNSFRDIPYIERSKYRQNMIYARGLL